MSGFSSIIPLASSMAGSALGAARSANSQAVAQAQLDAQNQAIDRQNQLLATQQAQQDQQQLTLLNQQEAAARAQMGAAGTGAGGGSADAILQGMAQRAADTIGYIDQGAALRTSPRRANLLDSANTLQWANGGLGVFNSFYDTIGRGGGSDALSLLG